MSIVITCEENDFVFDDCKFGIIKRAAQIFQVGLGLDMADLNQTPFFTSNY